MSVNIKEVAEITTAQLKENATAIQKAVEGILKGDRYVGDLVSKRVQDPLYQAQQKSLAADSRKHISDADEVNILAIGGQLAIDKGVVKPSVANGIEEADIQRLLDAGVSLAPADLRKSFGSTG